MNCSVPFLANELKTIFGLPDIKQNDTIISLDDYLELLQNYDKNIGNFFITEMRRLLAYRHLMCLKSNYHNNFGVCMFNNFKVSRLDYPVSLNEKNFCFNPDDNSCRVPKTMIKEWFENDYELFYSTMKDLLIDSGLDTDLKLKNVLITNIKKHCKYDGQIVYWVNSIVENSRVYLNY